MAWRGVLTPWPGRAPWRRYWCRSRATTRCAHAPNSDAMYSTPRRSKPSPSASSCHASSSSLPSCSAARVTVTPAPQATAVAPVTMRMRSLSFVYEIPAATARTRPTHRRRGEAENERPPPPATKEKGAADALAHSLDCSLHHKESILATVRLLRSSISAGNTAAAAPDADAATDTDT
uniref:Uncharacterized protein n=1 Tax=Oryza glumipatula TaxID=40148 RepID=A0A0D9ZJ38_9ORYZ